MRGLITTSDVLLHPLIIVAAFGLRVYARCLVRLVAGRATFLECAWRPERPLDLCLPRVDGVRVIKTLRNSPSTEGHADHHAVRRA